MSPLSNLYEDGQRFSHVGLLAVAVLAASAGTALAQQPLSGGSTSPGGVVSETEGLTDGVAMMVDKSGRVHHIKVKPGHHAALMKTAKPMPAGTVIYRSAGKYYMITDPKMSDP